MFWQTPKQHGIEEGHIDKMSKQNDDAARQAIADGAQTARQVAALTGMTHPQAQQAMNHLESTGEIKPEGTTGEGRYAATTYKPTNP